MPKSLLLALFAVVAFGQTTVEQTVSTQTIDRTFFFAQAKTPQEFEEATVILKSIANTKELSKDAAQKSLTVQGTADQIVLAQWLYNELDQSGAGTSREYHIPGKADDVTRVSYLAQPKSAPEFVETATMVRSIANVPQAYIFYPHRAVVMRGSAAQIGLASWLFSELEKHAIQPPSQASGAAEYRATDGRDGENVVRVFYLTNTATPQDFVEAATLVRSIADLRQVFMYNAQRAVTMRGTAGQLALADWLFRQIDKPAKEQVAASEYVVPDSNDVVSVMYLTQAGTPQELVKVATQIRTESKVSKMFMYNAPRVVAVRGTSQQVALAEQMSRPQ